MHGLEQAMRVLRKAEEMGNVEVIIEACKTVLDIRHELDPEGVERSAKELCDRLIRDVMHGLSSSDPAIRENAAQTAEIISAAWWKIKKPERS